MGTAACRPPWPRSPTAFEHALTANACQTNWAPRGGLREARLQDLRDDIGVDDMMWGSDHPHSESTFPQSRKILAEILAGVPEDEQAKIPRIAKSWPVPYRIRRRDIAREHGAAAPAEPLRLTWATSTTRIGFTEISSTLPRSRVPLCGSNY